MQWLLQRDYLPAANSPRYFFLTGQQRVVDHHANLFAKNSCNEWGSLVHRHIVHPGS